MADDPKFVRLASRLSRGMVADVHGSGWSISGLDVRSFPKDKTAARFVRAQINAGKLEPASKAEWEEAHDSTLEDEVLRQNPNFREEASAVQEARVQRAAAEGRQKLENRLSDAEQAELDEEAEMLAEDRKERLEEQREADLLTDDPEKQKARSAGQAERKKKARKSTKSKEKSEGSESQQ